MHAMEARQLQSLAQVQQLSQLLEHLQDALVAPPQPQAAPQAAQQPGAAWQDTDGGAIAVSAMAGMSLRQPSPQLASHPVPLTPDASRARLAPDEPGWTQRHVRNRCSPS